MNIPVYVIDQRAFWRDCFTQCLATSEANIAATGLATVADWLDFAEVEEPAIVLLCAFGREALDQVVDREIAAIRQTHPEAHVVIMTDVESPALTVRALERGARGLVTMALSLDIVIEAIRIVEVGGTFIPASNLMSVERPITTHGEPWPDSASRPSPFTARQLAIIACVRKGEPNKIIAYKLNMTESTVKVHVRNIMRKIKARNRTEVAFLTNEMALAGELAGSD